MSKKTLSNSWNYCEGQARKRKRGHLVDYKVRHSALPTLLGATLSGRRIVAVVLETASHIVLEVLGIQEKRQTARL